MHICELVHDITSIYYIYEMKFEAAVRGRVTPISGLRSFTKASVAVQTLGHAASFAVVCLVGVAFRVRVRMGSDQ